MTRQFLNENEMRRQHKSSKTYFSSWLEVSSKKCEAHAQLPSAHNPQVSQIYLRKTVVWYERPKIKIHFHTKVFFLEY